MVATAILLACPVLSQEALTVIEVRPGPDITEKFAWNKPVVITSMDEAAGVFGEDALAVLRQSVDFDRQFLLVFGWRGSGGDRLLHEILESDPEQIVFRRKPGVTKDLRRHAAVYALRSGVLWHIKGQE
jgi:hypothetical protein